MKLWIFFSNNNLSLEVDNDATIHRIHQDIFEKLGIPVNSLHLTFQGVHLEPQNTLQFHNIVDESVINASLISANPQLHCMCCLTGFTAGLEREQQHSRALPYLLQCGHSVCGACLSVLPSQLDPCALDMRRVQCPASCCGICTWFNETHPLSVDSNMLNTIQDDSTSHGHQCSSIADAALQAKLDQCQSVAELQQLEVSLVAACDEAGVRMGEVEQETQTASSSVKSLFDELVARLRAREAVLVSQVVAEQARKAGAVIALRNELAQMLVSVRLAVEKEKASANDDQSRNTSTRRNKRKKRNNNNNNNNNNNK